MDKSPEWLTAIGTISLAIVAVFQDRLRAWVMRPKLKVSVSLSPPDCHKTKILLSNANGQYQTECYFFRLTVRNSGNQRAEQVEVFASKLLKENADGEFCKVDSFLPMDLLWAHVHKPYLEAISPGMQKHCDLGHIFEPNGRNIYASEREILQGNPTNETLLSLDLEVKAMQRGYLIPSGKYQLHLLISASNAKPERITLEINHTGNWYPDEKTMLGTGIAISVI